MLQEIGEKLREAREAEGLTIEDVERKTRIRAKFLQALEAGDLEALPTSVQARGFLRNYARYVGLDPDEVIAELEYALELQNQSRLVALMRRAPGFRRKSGPAASSPVDDEPAEGDENYVKPQHRSLVGTPVSPNPQYQVRQLPLYWRIRRMLTPDVLILSTIVITILGGFLWAAMQLSAMLLAGTQPDATPEIIGPTATPTATLTPFANITFTPTLPPPLENFTEVQLDIIMEQSALVIVVVDGDEVFRGIARQGDELSFTGQQQIELSTGNAAGVRVILNRTDFGVLGNFGQVVTRVFLPIGMVTPTPTIDPIGTAAPDN